MSAPLSPNEQRMRGAALLGLTGTFAVLRALPPGGLPHWLPWQTSCGAVTGLPCIFCGMTRALHCLLRGDLHRALYFNWLAFPLFGAAASCFLLFLLEVTLRRRLIPRLPQFHFTRGTLAAALAGILLLWGLQVYLAVSQHKQELLNPSGPLYSLVVHQSP